MLYEFRIIASEEVGSGIIACDERTILALEGLVGAVGSIKMTTKSFPLDNHPLSDLQSRLNAV